MRKTFLTLLVLFSLTACTNAALPGDSKIPEIEIKKNMLTGLPGNDNEILVVKIDDTNQARPQTGIEDADVVYIEQVEGGDTRIAALYSSKYPEVVGPVRSARISDLEIFAQYGKIGFAFSGAQQKLLPVINSSVLINMSAEKFGYWEPYFRDESRFAPVNLYLHPNILLAKAHDKDLHFATAQKSGWVFGKATSGGRAALGVDFSWPAEKYGAVWDPTSKRWLIHQNGKPKMAKDGAQLGAGTLVVQSVAITPSEYGDKFGGITPHSSTIGSGTALIFRGGKVFSALWSRPTAAQSTTWKDEQGKDIAFAAGQIWIALVDQGRPAQVIEPTEVTPTPMPTTK